MYFFFIIENLNLILNVKFYGIWNLDLSFYVGAGQKYVVNNYSHRTNLTFFMRNAK